MIITPKASTSRLKTRDIGARQLNGCVPQPLGHLCVVGEAVGLHGLHLEVIHSRLADDIGVRQLYG